MEEIGLQIERPQDDVIQAVRAFIAKSGARLIEETPLRPGMALARAQPHPRGRGPARSTSTPVRIFDKGPHLAVLFESYFEYYFRTQRKRGLLVGPTVGRWTAVLYDEKAIDIQLVRWLSRHLDCRAVGYCFLETEAAEYSYIEIQGGREVELFSSFLADGDGRNTWSARGGEPAVPRDWIAAGFLKQRYNFIPGFYDLAFLRREKAGFSCYRYNAFPDKYTAAGNYPLDTFRYFLFHCPVE